ncbi:MAG: hypothetical protein H8E64_01920 [Candidatus Marinimicrobia bacterium]|nr:hypothetical protein [Candidatus Neomarinimicrobiota bacterium]
MAEKSNEKVLVNIEKFILFHKKRLSLLKEFVDKKDHGRLIFQICFLGFESLARLLYLKENSSKARFISLLSLPNNGITNNEATKLYHEWRCSLIHQGFIVTPWNTLENWNEYDISFLTYPENKLRSSTEYPPESIIAIYENRIKYLENYFKKINVKELELSL